MSKISDESAKAFVYGYEYHKDNTRVIDNAMYLHGNKIAERTSEGIFFYSCGWQTRTTASRLNAILDACYSKYIKLYTHKGAWVLTDGCGSRVEFLEGIKVK